MEHKTAKLQKGLTSAQKQQGLSLNPQGYIGEYLQKGRLNIGFIDGQWGSSGKGKFNALLAWDPELDFAVSHNSVNASHIVVWDDGREYKFQHLPTSVVNPKVKIVMGAGASIELPQLLKEIKDWGLDHTVVGYPNAPWADRQVGQRLFIHPNAVVITQDDVDYEKEHLVRIASTMTGNGAAAGRKVMRHPSTQTTSDCPELQQYICDTSSLIARWIAEGQTGILETAQGFDLSMDHGMLFDHNGGTHKAYPYCTSRNVDPLTFAGMTGVGLKSLGKVFLNLRALPIKVGDGSYS
jgi:adenylosuccinate synthase